MGYIQSMGSLRVGQDCVTHTHTHIPLWGSQANPAPFCGLGLSGHLSWGAGLSFSPASDLWSMALLRFTL